MRHALNLKLQRLRVTGILEESRSIQDSMLPSTPPRFEGFEIDGRTLTADPVSGDLFDYLSVAEDTLGLAIADSSGHGLPVALLATAAARSSGRSPRPATRALATRWTRSSRR